MKRTADLQQISRYLVTGCKKGDDGGMWRLPSHVNTEGKTVWLQIIASWGRGWDHVSVVVQGESRCPTWDEMCFVKGLFFEPDEVVVQYHVDDEDKQNTHEFCLHMWQPQRVIMPRPPKIMV